MGICPILASTEVTSRLEGRGSGRPPRSAQRPVVRREGGQEGDSEARCTSHRHQVRSSRLTHSSRQGWPGAVQGPGDTMPTWHCGHLAAGKGEKTPVRQNGHN